MAIIDLSLPNASDSSSWNNSAQNSQNFNDSYGYSWSNSSSQSYTDGTSATNRNKQFMNEANKIAQSNTAAEMAFNAYEAQKNRDWQEMMSNTAYQRAIKDMQAAGLNPILAAANGGATTPSGGMASTSAAQTFMANAIADSWSSSQSSSGSENRSHGEGYGSGWSSGGSQSISNIAEQVESGIGALANAWNSITDTNTGKKVQQTVNNAVDKVKDTLGNYTSGIDKVKDWMNNHSGLFTGALTK